MIKPIYYTAGAAWAAATARRPVGRSIFDHADDWDICIVLDSCRVDAMRAHAPDEWGRVGRAWSRGSITTEWVTQTFRPPHEALIGETTLLSANPHTSTVLDDGQWLTDASAAPVSYPSNPAVGRDAFDAVHNLWQTHADDHHAVPPETMADATIQVYRDGADRVVSHWLQPHEPFIADDADLIGGRATETSVWQAVEDGRADPAEVVQSYRANLAAALDQAQRVLDGVDAEVLITADHGNLFGELGQWGHPFGMLHPAVRRVPWITLSGTPTPGVTPSITLSRTADSDVTRQLEALGYR